MKKILILFLVISLILISSCSQVPNPKSLKDSQYCEKDKDCIIRKYICGDEVQNKYYPYPEQNLDEAEADIICARRWNLTHPRCDNNKCVARIFSKSLVTNPKFLENPDYCEQDTDCVIRELVCGPGVQNKYYPYDQERIEKMKKYVKCPQPKDLTNLHCDNNKCVADIDSNKQDNGNSVAQGNSVGKITASNDDKKAENIKFEEKTKTKEGRINSQAKFSCDNNNAKIKTRGYVFLMGYASHHKDEWRKEKELMEQDPKTKFVEIYDQDENLHIEEISEKFLADIEKLLKKYPVEELVLFGSSAGGVTASYSISKFEGELNFSGSVALHTMASPIKGYDLTGFRANFIGDRKGFLKDISIGFKPYKKPGKNVKVYHHKTVTDIGLLNYCGAMKSFCDEFEIQNNNIEGSKEFFYPQYDHETIMRGVV